MNFISRAYNEEHDKMPAGQLNVASQKQNKFEFTTRALKNLPLPEGRTRSGRPKDRAYYYDIKTPGLEAVITNTGATTFYAYYWSDKSSKPIRVRLGRFPGLSLENARKLAHDKVNEIIHGANPAEEKKLNREKLTVGTALDEYLNWLRINDRKATSITTFEYFAELIRVEFEAKPVNELTSEAIASFRSRLLEGKIHEARKAHLSAPQQPDQNPPVNTKKRNSHSGKTIKKGKKQPNRKVTANRTIRLLSQCYNHLIRVDIWDGKNPCLAIKPFPEQPRTRRLDDEELKAFINACETRKKNTDRTIPDFLLVCLFTGVRKSNVTSARWEYIDLKSGIWDVPETKNGLPMRIYLAPYVLKIFQDRRNLVSGDWVFPALSRSGHLEHPLRGLYQILDEAKIKKDDVSIHTLKHTFISYAYEAGISPIVITRMGGHKMREITARYGHASDKAVREGYIKVATDMLFVAGFHTNFIKLQVVNV